MPRAAAGSCRSLRRRQVAHGRTRAPWSEPWILLGRRRWLKTKAAEEVSCGDIENTVYMCTSDFLSFAAYQKVTIPPSQNRVLITFSGFGSQGHFWGLFPSISEQRTDMRHNAKARTYRNERRGRKARTFVFWELFPPPLLPRTFACSIALMSVGGAEKHGASERALGNSPKRAADPQRRPCRLTEEVTIIG